MAELVVQPLGDAATKIREYPYTAQELDCVVWHFTAGPGNPWRYLVTRTDKVLWHFTVLRSGVILQHGSLRKRYGHAGGSTYKGKKGVNARSVGIEVANLGPVDLLDGDTEGWASLCNTARGIPGGLRVKTPTGRFGRETRSGKEIRMAKTSDVYIDQNGDAWEAMSEAQLASIVLLGKALAEWSLEHDNGELADALNHVGHGDIKATKRPRGIPEPAPCFPWVSLRDTVHAVASTRNTAGR